MVLKRALKGFKSFSMALKGPRSPVKRTPGPFKRTSESLKRPRGPFDRLKKSKKILLKA